MTAKEAYEKLYRGALRDFTGWADDELEGVYKLAKADVRDDIMSSIEAEIHRRGKGELAK